MKLEVRKARAAAVAANLAAQAAVAARELLAEDPSAWEVGDAAYWLCRAAQEAAQNAADALDPEEALEDELHPLRLRTAAPTDAAGRSLRPGGRTGLPGRRTESRNPPLKHTADSFFQGGISP